MRVKSAVLMAVVLSVVPAGSAFAAPKAAFQGEHHRLADVDARRGTVRPAADQLARVAQLGATATWNRFGTPADLIDHRGALASGLGSDPEAAARAFLDANLVLFRLTSADVDRLETLAVQPVGTGHAVLLRQRLGGRDVTSGGLISIAVQDGSVHYVTSSATGDTSAPQDATLMAQEAWVLAARDVGRDVTLADVRSVEWRDGWVELDVRGMPAGQRSRLVAFPTPTEGNRPAFETIVLDARGDEHGPTGFTHFVDGRSGKVWQRVDRVNFAADNPTWRVFPANPLPAPASSPEADPSPTSTVFYDAPSKDVRQLWCWRWLPDADCGRVLAPESPRATLNGEWDRLFTPAVSVASFTTKGNNADAQEARLSPFTGGSDQYRPVSPSRDYDFEWTNEWNREHCSPSTIAVPSRGADVDAATANLFAMHNRMHDWSYFLGFRERTWNLQMHNFETGADARPGDPELGGVQAGALTGGPPSFLGRDNANQITLNDGIPGITNMYLWQPLAAGFYAPCVDGDYDMSVIGHEYTHAISNRMAAGPDEGLVGRQARSMGESWSDLAAVEHLNEFGLVPVADENPFSVGSYVTGDKRAGIRNYGMDRSPLNFSDIGYDLTGPQVHADGEIWSATNYDIRRLFIGRYGAGTPDRQAGCAIDKPPAQDCPGNRRWIQDMFAAWLFMQSDVNMERARNAYLTADQLMFRGANRDLLWLAFARRGLGTEAFSRDSRDGDSEANVDRRDAEGEADYTSPLHRSATITFDAAPAAGETGTPRDVRFFVGDYEARATPVADTIEGNEVEVEDGREAGGYRELSTFQTRRFVPGTYRFVAVAPGHGHVRFTRTFKAGEVATVTVPMPKNLSSVNAGATASPSSAGTDPHRLLDDTEDTQWTATGSSPSGDNGVAGADVKVDLAGATSTVRRVRVSALLRPAVPVEGDPADRDPSQSRFAALRHFAIETCRQTATRTCEADTDYRRIYTSAADAFPAIRPRPRAPQLIIRSFNVPDTPATHVRFVVLDNQCTGTPGYHGEQDADPANATDCRTSTARDRVFAAELQVLGVTAPF